MCISKDENEADQVCKNAFLAAFPTVMKKNLSPMKLCDRDKRDVHFSDDPTEEDFHIFKETASQLQPRFRRAVQPGYMSKDNATRYCEERISETEIGKLCVKIGVNVQGLVDACAADIVVRKKRLSTRINEDRVSPNKTWQGCCNLRNIPDGTHFHVAIATCSFPVSSSKSNITICSCRGAKYRFISGIFLRV